MKKIIFTLFILFNFLANAQVTFKPGVKAGITLSKFTGIIEDKNNFNSIVHKTSFSIKPDFYLGVLGTIDFTRFYALQPEVLYQRQGSIVSNLNEFDSVKVSLSYLSLNAANKFKFNKLNLQVVPSLDFLLDKNYNVENEVDISCALGVGYQINQNLGVEMRAKWGAIPVLYTEPILLGQTSSRMSHGNFSIQIGLTYSFSK